VYFYRHGDTSGLIPPVGGVMQLEGLESPGKFTLRDGSLIVRDASGIHIWTHELGSPQ